jgi:hypothetical protein
MSDNLLAYTKFYLLWGYYNRSGTFWAIYVQPAGNPFFGPWSHPLGPQILRATRCTAPRNRSAHAPAASAVPRRKKGELSFHLANQQLENWEIVHAMKCPL